MICFGTLQRQRAGSARMAGTLSRLTPVWIGGLQVGKRLPSIVSLASPPSVRFSTLLEPDKSQGILPVAPLFKALTSHSLMPTVLTAQQEHPA